MPTAAYEGVLGKSFIGLPVAAPLNASPLSGSQKAASNSVVGNDPAVTATLAAQPIGAASVAAGYIIYTPPILP